MVDITKEIAFEAAHYLHNPKWDRKRNLAVFKKCSGYRSDDLKASHFPHGHSYRLRVTVRGPVDPATGFVMDFKDLKEILKSRIFDRFDHRFLNREVAPFKGDPRLQTTVENLLKVMWDLLEKPLQKGKARLAELTLWETPTSSATYRGKKGLHEIAVRALPFFALTTPTFNSILLRWYRLKG
jgi:6-pyruvoyltetrahydropterin/6-carboxytetrahydropterin synthase